MAAYDLEEQEQLDELKTWWKLHGNLVTNILLAIGAGRCRPGRAGTGGSANSRHRRR
jgi:hypothetical protein